MPQHRFPMRRWVQMRHRVEERHPLHAGERSDSEGSLYKHRLPRGGRAAIGGGIIVDVIGADSVLGRDSANATRQSSLRAVAQKSGTLGDTTLPAAQNSRPRYSLPVVFDEFSRSD